MTYFEHLDDVFTFGKFAGCELGEVLMFCPDYLVWVNSTISGQTCSISDSAMDEIRCIFPNLTFPSDFEFKRRIRLSEREDFYEEEAKYERRERFENSPSYGRYRGSYAQDEMGYSDDDIDTIFDGDPSAYWNID